MRRFIETRRFKAISYLLTFALVLPFYAVLLARRAEAQIENREQWAVLPFSVSKPIAGTELSEAGATALTNELTRMVKNADIIAAETVKRDAEQLGFKLPVSTEQQVLRLGQSLGAATIVTGEIINQQIKTVSGKLVVGQVKVRVVVRDVISGMPINGAAVLGESSPRTADTDPATLYQDALASAASAIAGSVATNSLPKGTVLNTVDNTALVNMGIRSGFKEGQKVVVLRGKVLVANAEVTLVEPDSCYVRLTKSTRGIQPGDRIQVLFDVPEINAKFTGDGKVGVVKGKSKQNSGTLITVLIVVGLVALLAKNGNSNTAVTSVSSIALQEPDGRIGNQVSWRSDLFSKGRSQTVAWQIWRSDVVDAPVIVANDAALGGNSSIKDYGTGTGGTFYGKDPSADPTCPTALFSAGTATPTVIQSGVPYYYQVERVYRLSSLDNPNATAGSGGGSGGGTGGLTTGGSTGGSSGGLTGGGTTGGLTGRSYESPRDSYGYYQGTGLTTGGTTGTTGTTGGTTGTTGTTGGTTGGTSGGTDSQCYFVSDRSAASGTSTPFAVPTAQSPINNVTVTVPQVFKFLVQRPTTSSVVMKYVIQFSSDSSFARTVNTAEFTDNSSGSIVATPVAVPEVLTVFPGVAEVWWRVGIKNGADKNAPLGGYIFSAPQRFKRPTNPPNP